MKKIKITFIPSLGREPHETTMEEHVAPKMRMHLINMPANDPINLQVCASIASNGVAIKQDKNYLEYIAPSQIEKVEIIYDAAPLTALSKGGEA